MSDWRKTTIVFTAVLGLAIIYALKPEYEANPVFAIPAQQPEAQPRPPISTLNYYEVRDRMESLTSAMREDYKQHLIGKRVGWMGWVDDVRRDWSGEMTVYVDMDEPGIAASMADVTFIIHPDDARYLPRDSDVYVDGIIDAVSTMYGGAHIQLREVEYIPESGLR